MLCTLYCSHRAEETAAMKLCLRNAGGKHKHKRSTGAAVRPMPEVPEDRCLIIVEGFTSTVLLVVEGFTNTVKSRTSSVPSLLYPPFLLKQPCFYL